MFQVCPRLHILLLLLRNVELRWLSTYACACRNQALLLWFEHRFLGHASLSAKFTLADWGYPTLSQQKLLFKSLLTYLLCSVWVVDLGAVYFQLLALLVRIALAKHLNECCVLLGINT